LVPLAQVVISQVADRRRHQEGDLRQRVEPFLATSLIYLVRHARADFENTGVQAFLVKRRGLRGRHQIRIAKVRLGPIPPSGIAWTEGKGVIGGCWRTRTAHFVDLRRHFEPYEDHDQAAWEALPHDARYGLSFEEFQRVKGKYGIVAAAPIIGRDDRYVGCVTVDMPPAAPGQELPVREEVLGSLASAARLVAEVVKS
jgi:hypothetical protein